MYVRIHLYFSWIENCIWCDCDNMIVIFYEFDSSWLSMWWWWNISWSFSEIDSGIIVVGVVVYFSGMWICSEIGSTLIVGGVWFSTPITRGVSPTTLGTGGIKLYTLRRLLPWCGSWVSGGCTSHLKFYDSFLMSAIAGYSTLNGDACVGFSRAWINYNATIAAAYAKEVLGISKWWGKKSTVYGVLSDLVLVM